ncbi:MAG: metallophosphoesterase, partial [Candidatus Promineifilaceae bacterium]|nr:metallophosphoesterase [Candidatus Promineifilaceae bacterium]
MKKAARLHRSILASLLILLLAVSLVSLSLASVPGDSTTTRFAVIGDFGKAGPDEEAVANLIQGWNVDFVATVGDNNYPDGAASTIDENIGQYYHPFIKPYVGGYGSGAADVNRFFPALGNHDWHDISCDATGANCTGAHFDYFALPGNERYYDIPWGPVHLFIVNSNSAEPDGRNASSDQAAWLQGALATSTAPWKLVFMHHAPYSSADRHGSTTTMQWPYKEWGADAVFAGHDHTYERLLIDDFPYFVDGVGGNSLRGFANPPLEGSIVRYSDDYGAMLVEASESSITYQFYNTQGELIDSYTVQEDAPPTATPTGTATATATATPTITPAPGCYILTLVSVGFGDAPTADPSGSAGCATDH